jgi:hypothetical protein
VMAVSTVIAFLVPNRREGTARRTIRVTLCRAKLPRLRQGRRAMKVTQAFLAAFLLVGAGEGAKAQSLSVNPSAAASEVRNPSSINPAAAASDIRNPSAINPSARGSQLVGPSAMSPSGPGGVAPGIPRQRIAPSSRPSPAERPLSPSERRTSQDKPDSKSSRPGTLEVPDTDARSDEAAKARHDDQYERWDAAAKRAIGSICDGCGGATPMKPAQKPARRTRRAG